MHADGEVVHDPQRHSRRHRLRLRGGELLVELPLQPAMEIDRRSMLGDELGDAVSAGMLHRLGPLVPVAAVLLGQRAPGGEVVERGALAVAVRRVRQFAAGGPRDPVDQFQRRPLGRPRGVAVDGVQRGGVLLHIVAQPPHPAAFAQVGEFGNGLDAQIERVDEAARRRQIRRRLHRRGRRGRVQRIDQHITGAVHRRRPHRKVNEIGEVADAPGLSGPDAI